MIIEKNVSKLEWPHAGSISSGTLRIQDLLPVFINKLLDLASESNLVDGMGERKSNYLLHEGRLGLTDDICELLEDFNLFAVDMPELDSPFCDEEERQGILSEGDFLIEKVSDLLNEFGPDEYCFGVHPGNSSDFGFWLCDEENNDDTELVRGWMDDSTNNTDESEA